MVSAPQAGSRQPAAQSSDRVSQPKHDSFLVVALGASAGGLEAVKTLLRALPANTGMAFVLVQHLDPTHRSMLVDLLARETAMTVVQAGDQMPIEPDCLYVIPPQADLSVHDGMLRLSPPAIATACTCRSISF